MNCAAYYGLGHLRICKPEDFWLTAFQFGKSATSTRLESGCINSRAMHCAIHETADVATLQSRRHCLSPSGHRWAKSALRPDARPAASASISSRSSVKPDGVDAITFRLLLLFQVVADFNSSASDGTELNGQHMSMTSFAILQISHLRRSRRRHRVDPRRARRQDRPQPPHERDARSDGAGDLQGLVRRFRSHAGENGRPRALSRAGAMGAIPGSAG